MKQTIKALFSLLRIRLSGMMMYRLSFFTAMFVDSTLFLMQLLFFRLLVSASTTIAWSADMYTLFVGSFMTLDGLYMATWFFGVISLPDLIRTGELDLMLVRPLHTLLYASFCKIDIGSVPIMLVGILVTLIGAARMGCLTVGNVLLWVMAIALMYVLMYALSLLIRSCAFWTKSVDSLGMVEGELVNYSFRLPLPAITGAWRLILLLGLPYGLVANFPAYALSGQAPLLWWVYTLAVTAVFFLLAQVVWRKGLSRYESASS